MDDESDDAYPNSTLQRRLVEILEKGGFSLGAFGAERVSLLLFSYVVTAVIGARVYGFISVFTRGLKIVRALYASIMVSNNRTIPRYDADGQRSILTLNVLLMMSIWALACVLLVVFRGSIVSNTLLLERHSQSVIVFGIWLLPLLTLSFVGSAFRSFRQIRISVIISKIAVPVALLVGTGGTILLTSSPTVTQILVGTVVLTTAVAVVSLALLYRDTIFTGNLEMNNPGAIRDFAGFLKTSTAVSILGFAQRGSVFVLLAVLVSPVGAGLFSLALILARITRWPLDGINETMPAVSTKLYEQDQSDKIDTLYKRTSRIALFCAMPVSIPLVVFHSEILTSFSSAYASAAVILPLVILGQTVATAIGSVGILLLMTDSQTEAAIINLVNAVVILPVILYLTSQYGVIGLGAGYAFSLVFNNVTEAVALWYVEQFVALTKQHFSIFGLAAVITGTLYFMNSILSLPSSVFVSAVGVFIHVTLSYTVFLDEMDKQAIAKASHRIKERT